MTNVGKSGSYGPPNAGPEGGPSGAPTMDEIKAGLAEVAEALERISQERDQCTREYLGALDQTSQSAQAAHALRMQAFQRAAASLQTRHEQLLAARKGTFNDEINARRQTMAQQSADRAAALAEKRRRNAEELQQLRMAAGLTPPATPPAAAAPPASPPAESAPSASAPVEVDSPPPSRRRPWLRWPR